MLKRVFWGEITILLAIMGAALGGIGDGFENPSVAADPNAFRFIMVYNGHNNDYDDEECIYANIYDYDNPYGTSSMNRISESHDVEHNDPDIAMNQDHVAVVWTSSDSDGEGIIGRIFDPNLVALTGEFAINSITAGNQYAPAVAIDNQGRFMAVWTRGVEPNREVHGRIFNTAGQPLCPELTIANTHDNFSPAVAADPNGVFTVAWAGTSLPKYGVYMQQYYPDGTAKGIKKILANSLITQPNVSVDVNQHSTILAAWDGHPFSTSQGYIFARLYDPNGNDLGIPSPSVINTYDEGKQQKPSAAISDNGRFVVAWQSENSDGNDDGICGRAYDPNGVAEGDEFDINLFIYRKQHQPDVAMSYNDWFFTVWQHEAESCYDDGRDIWCEYFHEIDHQLGAKPTPDNYQTRGDVTGNGSVDLNDLAALAERWMAWGRIVGLPHPDSYPDGHIDMIDFSIMADNWMQCCTPFFPPEYQWVWDQNRLIVCATRVKGFMTAIMIYANDYDGCYPPDLETLAAEVEVSPWPDEAFLCPAVCPHIEESDYVYRGNDLSASDSAMMIVIYDKQGNHANNMRNVAFADGHVSSLTEEEFQAAIELDNTYRRSNPRLEEKPAE